MSEIELHHLPEAQYKFVFVVFFVFLLLLFFAYYSFVIFHLQLDLLLNGTSVDALATVVHKDKAYKVGKNICKKLKENIHR